MSQKKKSAISPTRAENYADWYQQVIKAADLAENSPSRGCMIIKPWGFGIWEKLQQQLDARIKATGHENAYFPLFIPLSFLEKEAAHVEGFAKECAVVTHHRLEQSGDSLIPTGLLEEPLVVRPTSETIIGDAFSRWVQSYRDLPLLINQWANVVRWEMRPRLFLRTAEFLWQEGHTVHVDEDDARREVMQMLEVYREFVEEVLAVSVISGEKTEGERFPGAVNTYCIEAMMQDGKALQAGTSHYLGENFSRASNIRFLDKDSELRYAHTTSWGVSTRLIGALIMSHADDDGMRIPPKLAPQQVVILPVIPNEEVRAEVLEACRKLKEQIADKTYNNFPIAVKVDTRDLRGGEKSWQWIKKGIPLRIEIGPKDLASKKAPVYRRDKAPKDKTFLGLGEIAPRVSKLLAEIQGGYLTTSKNFLKKHTRTDIQDMESLVDFYSSDDGSDSGVSGGFALVKCSGSKAAEEKLAEHKLTVRCLPLNQSGTTGKCIITGESTERDAVIAKAY